jgi:cobyrinic acid a,c-diamide synthase
MYAVRVTTVIVEKVTSKRLTLLLIRKPITKQSDLLGLVKLDLPMNLHHQHLR